MNPQPDYVKTCSRCGLPVRLTPAAYAAERDQLETTCDRCRAILTAEAAEILKHAAAHPFPKDEASKPQLSRPGGTNPT